MTDVQTRDWSGEGSFTQLLIDALREIPEIAAVRVEDAPASRDGAGYNFIANELFVTFASGVARERARWLGILPFTRKRRVFLMDLDMLTSRLSAADGIGEPDYTDEGMIQYLRTERIIAPYQKKGVKVIELVRIYAAGEARG